MRKLFAIGILLSSLICYLEWGKANEQSGFLFQMEYSLIFGKGNILASIAHPLVLLPLLAQILLIIVLFQHKPSKLLLLVSTAFFCSLIVIIFLAGLLSKNWKIISFTLPFLSIAIFFFVTYKKR